MFFYLSIFFLVGALDSGIDLLEALNFHTNLSQYDGVSITKGSSPQQIAYHLESK